MRPVRQVLLLARHASETASGAAGGCPQSVESAILRAFEDASRTTEACFAHRMLQKMRRVPQEPVLSTARIFRTVEACFLHRMPMKMRRVPQEPVLSTARIFRTPGACFRYRVLSQRQVAAAAEPGVHFSRPLFFRYIYSLV